MDTEKLKNNPYAFPQSSDNNEMHDDYNGMLLRDYFAAKAMVVISSETQEAKVASFWDWIKWLLVVFLHMSFLHVKYKSVDGMKEEIAKKSYELADAMLKEKYKNL